MLPDDLNEIDEIDFCTESVCFQKKLFLKIVEANYV